MEEKQNPKHVQAQKEGKAPLEYLVGLTVDASEARVLKHGADKYGVRNWRVDKILASTYEGSLRRHLLAWISGEDIDPDSGEPHLAHIRANCAIVLDAQAHDTFIDDRDRAVSGVQQMAGNAHAAGRPNFFNADPAGMAQAKPMSPEPFGLYNPND